MKGFIEVNIMVNAFWEKVNIHYTQLHFNSDRKFYWNGKMIKETYDQIKELIKNAQ